MHQTPIEYSSDHRSSEKGSTLIEVMIMLSVAVVVIAATLSGVVQHGRQRKSNAELSLAMSACRNTLEALRSVDFAVLPSMDGQGFDVPSIDGSPGGLQPVEGDPDGLPGQISVTVEDSAGSVFLYRVEAEVTWRGLNPKGSFALMTLFSERK